MQAERPILFSAPMVRAILAGTKSQTRRIVKLNDAGRVAMAGKQWHIDDPNAVLASPYGRPGERLWVREAWRQAYAKTSYSEGVVYRADAARALGMDEYSDRHTWKPSIFMPRRYSRITLEVTGVRAERLQAISDDDVIAEGISNDGCDSQSDNFAAYRDLWESINGHGSWDANPWVWVVEFRRIANG